MSNKSLIAVEEICVSHRIDFSFLQTLHQSGLIEITTVKNTFYVPETELPQLEKIMTLHFELDINVEGIETIVHLLNQQQQLQSQITLLKNKLHLYEEPD